MFYDISNLDLKERFYVIIEINGVYEIVSYKSKFNIAYKTFFKFIHSDIERYKNKTRIILCNINFKTVLEWNKNGIFGVSNIIKMTR